MTNPSIEQVIEAAKKVGFQIRGYTIVPEYETANTLTDKLLALTHIDGEPK